MAAASDTQGFHGFSPKLFEFYDGLAANQSRDWFQAHKAEYETQVRAPLVALVEALSFAFAAHDIPLQGDPKRSMFRIYRDVRFSNNKAPYKTNASAVLSRDGAKSAKGIFYFHIGGPEREVFAAMGFYGPEPEDLAALRQAIAQSPDRWLAAVSALEQAGLGLVRDSALSRMPKGFEAQAETPAAADLKLRNLIVTRRFDAQAIHQPELVEDLVAFAADGLPLLEFGWRALAARPGPQRG